MARRERRGLARSVRFGRLDRAAWRLDRDRAENAIHRLTGGRRQVEWAAGLVQAVEAAAGRASDPSLGRVVSRQAGDGWTVFSGRDPLRDRLRTVARLDERLLVAARHAAASGVPAGERLSFR